MTRSTAAVREAAADRASLRVLRRMASHIRHDLAGAMLLPQTQLQMLQRRLQKPGATLDTAISGIDEALIRFHELKDVHRYSASFLALHDSTPAAVDEVLRKVATSFGLLFSFNGVNVNCSVLVTELTYPAQPLHLLVNACFFAILDSKPSPGVLHVACSPMADSVTLEWRLESDSDAPGIGTPADMMTDPELLLDTADVKVLCARYGCRFVPGVRHWTLLLDRPGSKPSQSLSDESSFCPAPPTE